MPKQPAQPKAESLPDLKLPDESSELTETEGDIVTGDVAVKPVEETVKDDAPTSNPKPPTNDTSSVSLSSSELAVYNRLNTRRMSCGWQFGFG